MQLALKPETRQWDAQKGAQHENTFGRGCSWYAGEIFYHKRYRIIKRAIEAGITPVIPPKKNRKVLRDYDKHLYKLRHLVENAFLHLKKWRGLPPDMLKMSHLLLLLFKLDVSLFG